MAKPQQSSSITAEHFLQQAGHNENAGFIFALSKSFIAMPPEEIEKLLKSKRYGAIAGALSIMDKQASLPKTSEERLGELYDLYIKYIDVVNDWKLVDVSCRYTVGRYLLDKSHDVLLKLARSKDVWQRRIAIISTWYFIQKGKTADTFKISELLLEDKEETIQKAVGWMLREAGKKDQHALVSFLDKYAVHMPRKMLRSALEQIDKTKRVHYLEIGKK